MTKSVIKEHKSLFKLDITYAGGVPMILKDAYITLFKKSKYYLLCEEGTKVEEDVHYHLHGVIGSDYKKSSDFRRRVLKPLYEKIGLELTPVGTKIKNVTVLSGALSYCYKEKNVLCSSGILLEQIKPWKKKLGTPKLKKEVVIVGKSNFFKLVAGYCEQTGIKPTSYYDIADVRVEMRKEGYLFRSGPWLKSEIGLVLQYFGDDAYVEDCWTLYARPIEGTI